MTNEAGPHRLLTSSHAGLPRVTGGGLPDAYGSVNPYRNAGYDAGFADTGNRIDLMAYWRILLKHRVLIGSVTAAALCIGVLYTLTLTPLYMASVKIEFASDPISSINLPGGPQPGAADRQSVETQMQLLKSRSLADRVATSLNLANNAAFVSSQASSPLAKLKAAIFGKRAGAEDLDLATRKAIAVGRVLGGTGVAPVGASRIIQITYSSPDPQIAQRVVNAIADNFISANLDRQFEANAYVRKFLEERLQQTKARLEDSERKLVEYAEQKQIVKLDESKSLASSNLTAVSGALAEAKLDRITQEGIWTQAETTDGGSLPQVLDSPIIQSLRTTKFNLEADYRDKLTVYTPSYPAMVTLRSKIAEVNKQVAGEVVRIKESIRAKYEAALDREKTLQEQLAKLQEAFLSFRSRNIQYTILEREVDTNRTLYNGLLQRYKEVGVTGGVDKASMSIVDRADRPGAPYSPRMSLNLSIALAAGLFLGIGLAFALEHIDDTLKSPEQMEAELGLPVLGIIPVVEPGLSVPEALADLRSHLYEAYVSTRTALQFSTEYGVPKSLLLTSPRPAEGKSTSALALARAFAQLGLRVLLIDADLRRPSLFRLFGTDNNSGLSTYLTGSAEAHTLLRPTGIPNLAFMPSGPLPPNAAELLAGPKMSALVTIAGENFDLVLIDGPPVLGLADAPLLSSIVGGTLFVCAAGEGQPKLAKTALRRLLFARAQVLGGILTKFDVRKVGYGYGHHYYSGYSQYGYGGEDETSEDPELEAPDDALELEKPDADHSEAEPRDSGKPDGPGASTGV